MSTPGTFVKAEPEALRDLCLGERWLQTQIKNDTTIPGLRLFQWRDFLPRVLCR